MEIKVFDIVMLFVLSIVLSMMIGYNIIFVIDKKISSVNINIPPIKIPKSEITINMNDKNKFTVNETFVTHNKAQEVNKNTTVHKTYF